MKKVSPFTLLAAALLPLFAWAGPVDINTADAKTLARELQGIGLARAESIIAYREQNGPFKSAEDLAKVKGIGMKVVEQNRSNIQLTRSAKADKEKTPKNAKNKNPDNDDVATGP